MATRSLPILIFVFIVAFSWQETMAASTDERKLLSDTSAIVNIGAGGITSTVPRTQGSEALFTADAVTLSSEKIGYNDEREMLYFNLSDKGVQFIQASRFNDAADVFKEAIALKPDLPHAYINLANAYYHLGKYEKSIEMSKIALVLDSTDAYSYCNLGNAYNALGKRAEAKENYKKAMELFRKDGNKEAVKKMEESLAENENNLLKIVL